MLGLSIDFHGNVSYSFLSLLFLLFRRFRICRRIQKSLKFSIIDKLINCNSKKWQLQSYYLIERSIYLQFRIIHNTVRLIRVEIKRNSRNFMRSIRHQKYRKFELCRVFVWFFIQHLREKCDVGKFYYITTRELINK